MSPASLKGAETIVVAEDSERVRRLVTDVVESQGYEVLTATDGRAALTIVESSGRPIELLVTDVMMPEMKGPELYDPVRALDPTVPVLFRSGYGEESKVTRRVSSEGEAFLQKPFSPVALLSEIRRLRDGADEGSDMRSLT